MEHTANYLKIESTLKNILELQKKYYFDESIIDKTNKELAILDQFQVVTPIIGKFSAGKSSLVNALLGEKYLGVALTPETSVPAEICYATKDNEQVTLIKDDQIIDTMSIEDLKNVELDIEKVDKIQVFINNDFLKSISTVKLADMPGFDSGIELHQQAIDNYLPISQAYIIVLDVRYPTIEESIKVFLKELNLHNKPIFFLANKADGVSAEQLEEALQALTSNIKTFLDIEKIIINPVSSRKAEIGIEPIKAYLRSIEEESQNIFVKEKQQLINYNCNELLVYLETQIKMAEVPNIDLEEALRENQQDLEKLKETLNKQRESFRRQIDTAITSISTQTTGSLRSASGTLQNQLLNEQDLSDTVNTIVRNNILNGIKEQVDPKFHQYMNEASKAVSAGLNANIQGLTIDTSSMLGNLTSIASVSIVPLIIKTLGKFIGTGPAMIVGGIIALFVSFLGSNNNESKRRAEANRQVNQMISDVSSNVDSNLRSALMAKFDEIDQTLTKEAEDLFAAKEKAIEDLKGQIEKSENDRKAHLADLTADVELVKSYMKG